MTEDKAEYVISPVKTSVYLEASTLQFFNDVTVKNVKFSRSAEINRSVKDLAMLYHSLIPDELRKNAEFWSVLLNVYAGSKSVANIHPVGIAIDILDCYGVLSVDELNKHEKSALQVAAKLSVPVQMAILFVIRKFWARTEDIFTSEPLMVTINKLCDGGDV